MSHWVRLMLAGGEFDGKRIVSEKSFKEILKPQITIALGKQ